MTTEPQAEPATTARRTSAVTHDSVNFVHISFPPSVVCPAEEPSDAISRLPNVWGKPWGSAGDWDCRAPAGIAQHLCTRDGQLRGIDPLTSRMRSTRSRTGPGIRSGEGELRRRAHKEGSPRCQHGDPLATTMAPQILLEEHHLLADLFATGEESVEVDAAGDLLTVVTTSRPLNEVAT